MLSSWPCWLLVARTAILAKREQQKWDRTVYILAHGTDVPVAPGPDLLSALVSLALRREHVNVVLVGVRELLGVLVALRLHGVRTLHVRRLLLVV